MVPELEKALTGAKTMSIVGMCKNAGKTTVLNEIIRELSAAGCVMGLTSIGRDGESKDLVTGTIDGLYTFTHPFGCSQTGADHAQTRKLLAALAKHPNAGAVLVLGLGCENLTMEQFKAELGEYDPQRIQFLVCQQVEDELEEGAKLLEVCAKFASSFSREECTADKLVIGMKCGGSDGLSGITANPTVGRFSDMLIAQGGSTVLTEVPEMFGAEGFLMDRCINQTVFQKAADMLNGFKDYFLRHGEVVYENPSPGNKAGGITTLEEKSCGCVQKGGSAPIVDVIDYGESVVEKILNDGVRDYRVRYNENHVKFYSTLPCLDFSVYARAAMEDVLWGSLQEELEPLVQSMSEADAVNLLLHFVQFAFKYEEDGKQYGYEKWNFAEETVGASFSDCDEHFLIDSFKNSLILFCSLVIMKL